MRRTFVDDELQAEFEEQGFVMMDLLDQDAVARARAVVDRLYVGARSGMHTTIQSPDYAYRKEVLDAIPPLFEGLLDDVLDNHDLITASLLVKWPGEGSGFCTHQDWSMVDERKFRSVNIWCPLVDVDERNGALAVLPESHKYLDHLRCSPRNPREFVSEGTLVSHREMDVISMRAGQALIFDNGLLHGSDLNRTQEPRIAVVLMMKPREAEIQHYFMPDADLWTAERYLVDKEFLVDFVIGQRPKGTPVGTVEFYGTPRTREELLGLCGRSPLPDDEAPRIPPPVVRFVKHAPLAGDGPQRPSEAPLQGVSEGATQDPAPGDSQQHRSISGRLAQLLARFRIKAGP